MATKKKKRPLLDENKEWYEEQVNEFKECRARMNIPMIEQLRVSKDIKEVNLGNENFSKCIQ